MRRDMLGEPRAVFGEAKIPVFLLDEDHLAPFGTELALRIALFVGEKLLLPHAVMPAMPRFVEVSLVMQLLQHVLHRGDVARIRRLGPAVVSNAELLPERFEFRGDVAREFRRCHPGLLGRLLHFLSVLVDAGQEKHRPSALAVPARNDIGQDLFVCVANVRRRVRVIDRRGDEKSLRGHFPPSKPHPASNPTPKSAG